MLEVRKVAAIAGWPRARSMDVERALGEARSVVGRDYVDLVPRASVALAGDMRLLCLLDAVRENASAELRGVAWARSGGCSARPAPATSGP